MPITKVKKQEIVAKVAEALKDAKSVVFFHFKQMPVKESTIMRRTLRAEGVGYLVAKKTLTKRALDAKQYEGTIPEMPGETAFAYSTDLIAPAREVYNFEKKFKDKISIVGGVFDGKYMNKEEMLKIALIPGMQTLRAQFVNVINSPIQGLVVALSKIAEKKV